MKQPVDPDQGLVQSAKSGSRTALGVLLQRHEPLIRRAASRILRNTDDVEDCIQETNTRVTASLHTFREEAPFGPWVRRIAINAAISSLRRRKGQVAESLTVEPVSDAPAVMDRLVTDERAKQTRHALATLPAKHRRVLELRLVAGLSHTQIAEILQVPHSSARVLFVRALRQLRKALGVRDA